MTQQVQYPRSASGMTSQMHRPGLVLFPAVMLFTLSGFLVIVAISEWANSFWLYDKNFTVVGNHLAYWGFVDFASGCVSAAAAYMILDGRRVGQVLGLMFAGISAIRWLFYIPADPWLALAVIAIDSLVIYALTAHDEWFARTA